MVDKDKIEQTFWNNFSSNGLLDIADDGLISVNDTCSLISPQPNLPVAFDRINGNFFCLSCDLTSARGFPREVAGTLNCTRNKLKSCEGMPQTIGQDLICDGNEIASLIGVPKTIPGSLKLRSNRLSSLFGAPETIGGSFTLRNNPLQSLEGAPKKIGRRIILTGSRSLPLLRLIGIEVKDIALDGENQSSEHEVAENIINKWIRAAGSIRSRIIGCQSELIANGFEGNAKW